MSLFMVEWRALDVKASSSLFVSGAFPLPATLKVISSVHALDKPRGWTLIDGPPEDLYAAVLALPPDVLLIEVNPVIDDHAAKKGLEHRHSAYKLK
jgi:hypothetical protein